MNRPLIIRLVVWISLVAPSLCLPGGAHAAEDESFDSPVGEWSEQYKYGSQWRSSEVTIIDETKATYTNPNGQVFFYAIDDQGKWEGYWVEALGGRCLEEKYGSKKWGVMIYQFNDAYNKYEGTWDRCGQGPKYPMKGVR